MKIILKTLQIQGLEIIISETENDIEIMVANQKKKSRASKKIISYLESEGILDEIFAGNTNFEKEIEI